MEDRVFLGTYLTQLLFPVLLLLDVELAFRFPAETRGVAPRWWFDFGTVGQAVFVGAGLWLVTGLGALLLSRYIKLFPYSKLRGPMVIGYAVCLSLLILELTLQVVPRSLSPPALGSPGRQTLLQPDPGVMPGIHGVSTFTISDVGLRAPPLPSDPEVFNIIAMGDSTTKELYLDDSETWPYLMMEEINTRRPEAPVWVGNAGHSGGNAVAHLILMEILPVVDKADLLIFLIGFSDFQPAMTLAGGPTQEVMERHAVEFRRQVLRGGGWVRPPRPYFKHSHVYQLFRDSKIAQLAALVPPDVFGQLGVGPGPFYEMVRRQRAEAPVVPMPPLDTNLEDYRQRIVSLGSSCRARSVRCLFLTQPSMFRDDLTPDEESLLWFGWVNRASMDRGYVSAGDMATGLALFNQTLLEVCLRDGLECYDLAPQVPKDTSVFYDDVHFNEGGARLVARLLTDYLLSNPANPAVDADRR